MTAEPRHGRGREEASTRELLAAMSFGDPGDQLRLRDLLTGLGKRVFGMMLFVATLPAFIPVPGVGGAVGGPLVVLVGVQLLLGLRRPWLPRFLAERGPHRRRIRRSRRGRSRHLHGRLRRVYRWWRSRSVARRRRAHSTQQHDARKPTHPDPRTRSPPRRHCRHRSRWNRAMHPPTSLPTCGEA